MRTGGMYTFPLYARRVNGNLLEWVIEKYIKATVTQFKKLLITDRFNVNKKSWKFCGLITYGFTVTLMLEVFVNEIFADFIFAIYVVIPKNLFRKTEEIC